MSRGACGNAKAWPSGLQLLVTSSDVYGAAVGALELAQRWTAATQLLEEMRSSRLEPGVERRSAALSACQGQWRLAIAPRPRALDGLSMPFMVDKV